MSHFTRLQTRITDKDLLKKALQDMKLKYIEGDVEIKGYGGQKARVELKVRVAGHDVGFINTGGVYEAVADWMTATGLNRDEFLRNLHQRYAYHAAKNRLEEQGFSLVSEDIQEDGGIRLVLRRMA